MIDRDTFARRWLRRVVSLGVCSTAFCAITPVLPIVLAVAAGADISARRRFSTFRALAFLYVFLSMEVLGIVLCAAIWIAAGGPFRRRNEPFETWNFRLQCWWGSTLAAAGFRLFGCSYHIENEYVFGERPIVLFIRHSAMADTILPVYFLSKRYGVRLRYVLKRTLLWDPCLDIVGNRIPNVFVRRGSAAGDDELHRIAALTKDLGPKDGVLIYPEGTRFTKAKYEHRAARMAEKKDPLSNRYARAYTHVMAPVLGGSLALLQHNSGADAVFFAHTGLEGSATFPQLFNGALIGQDVRVKIWGVPFEAIPTDRDGQAAWLFDEWTKVDAFVRDRLVVES